MFVDTDAALTAELVFRIVDAARLLTHREADRADRGADVTREFAMAKVNAI